MVETRKTTTATTTTISRGGRGRRGGRMVRLALSRRWPAQFNDPFELTTHRFDSRRWASHLLLVELVRSPFPPLPPCETKVVAVSLFAVLPPRSPREIKPLAGPSML